jgi:hypothetical protein
LAVTSGPIGDAIARDTGTPDEDGLDEDVVVELPDDGAGDAGVVVAAGADVVVVVVVVDDAAGAGEPVAASDEDAGNGSRSPVR